MKKEDYIKKSYETIEQIDMKNLTNTYQANLVYKSLDLTRETIRYYEKLGLIQPEKNKNGKYRSFTLHDMQRLLEIDFYKNVAFKHLK